MEVLSSGGPGRPRARPGRLPRTRRPLTPPRWMVVGAGVPVAVAALLLLRASADLLVPTASDPLPVSGYSLDRPAEPFDHVRGRTPIPAPTMDVDRVSGDLPPSGGPDRAAALHAVQLVLGRYCRWPDRYELTAAPMDGWLSLGVLAVSRDRTDDSLIDMSLIWTGRSYRWTGVPDQLRLC